LLTRPFFRTERSGKTIHLLKSGSKKIATDRKRKKHELMGTLHQYKESKKKPQAQQPPKQQPPAQGAPPAQIGEQKPQASSLAPPFQLQMFAKPQGDNKKDSEMKKK
jgi:hypothetical protein